MTTELPPGVRKYRAFLFSLTALVLIAVALPLTGPEFIKGLAMVLGLFVGANAVVHSARALGKNNEVS